MTTKNDGTKITARHVDAIIPLNTDRPSDTRALAPAPVAVTNGNTPRMNANEVIRIGRNLVRAASSAASRIGSPEARLSRATSTIRIAFFADNAISSTNPIWVYRLLATPRLPSVTNGPISDSGTARRTDRGAIQLSYCPARHRYTSSNPNPNA